MPDLLADRFRRLLAASTVLCGIALAFGANAQMPPPGVPPATANPMCQRLEAQLAAVDRGTSGDPGRDDQIRRYQDAANRQQSELDRVTQQARRMGCESSGFFSLFNGRSAQCEPVNNQIQQMRANLDQMTSSLERLRTGGAAGPDRENQRRSVLLALAQNNCGPQYANAVQSQGNFFNNLFGGNSSGVAPPPAELGPDSGGGTYRTVCVRTCDGAYFPISFATVPARFPDDERSCKALCPAAEASLYTYRNPGQDMNAAVSVNGQPYTALPNAFKFRTEFNPSCSCKAPGQTWADALKTIDEKAAAEQQGDIIVTEESAKRMQQRQMAKQPPASARKGTTAAAVAPAESASPPVETNAAPRDNKQIRSVGPTFIQTR